MNSTDRTILVTHKERPSLYHLKLACRDLLDFEKISYKALGRAVNTLKTYKMRFECFDIGDVVEEKY